MRSRTLASALLALLVTAGVAPGYYHFLHFSSRTGSVGQPEKFDLNALRNKTVSYFIAESGGLQFSQNDSYLGMASEIRLAAKTWNDVETSDLRLAYGGTLTPGATSASPTLEISFDEQPPGVIAFGGPVVRAASNGTFIPILKSVVVVRPDLTRFPSYGESFFGTVVHEMGHALGLQHTFTSSVMSTSWTRATTKSHPLAADDIAGISALYPRPAFYAANGSISGRVTLGNGGVNLASVVAISPNGVAVSALTSPDGTYRIDGLPPRQYLVYVHPLPPAVPGQSRPGDITYPVDLNNALIGPGAFFDTVFFPGTPNPAGAFPLAVQAGQSINGVNFAVRQRNSVSLHTVSTYAFPGNIAVQPPYLNTDPQMVPRIVASGYGLVSGSAPTPGLGVAVLGGANIGLRPYSPAPTGFLQMDMDIRTLTFSGDSPRHLIFNLNGETYVLPSGFILTEKMPPSIASVIPSFDGPTRTAVLTGTNFSSTSRVLFDGVPAAIRNLTEGRLTVMPPAAPAGHRANVVVLNADGQSSLFLQDTPQQYVYSDAVIASATANSGGLQISPSTLPAGVEASVQIDVPEANFVDGQTALAFGTSDIVVRQIFVVSPTRLLANLSISPAAQSTALTVTAISGLQTFTLPFGFALQPFNPRAAWISPSIINAASGSTVVSAGSAAIVTLANTSVAPTNSTVVYVNDRPTPVTAVAGNQLRFQIPAGLSTGPATLRVENSADRSFNIAFTISAPPPQILSMSSVSNPVVDAQHGLHPGELATISALGLDGVGTSIDPSRVLLNIGGSTFQALFVAESAGTYRITLSAPSILPGGLQSLTISFDGRVSEPFPILIAN